MSVRFTSNDKMLDSVSVATTSDAFSISQRSDASVEFSSPDAIGQVVFTVQVSNDGTNFVTYNRLVQNSTNDNTHNDTRISSVTLDDVTTNGFVMMSYGDYARYIRTVMVVNSGGILTSSINTAGTGYTANDVLTIADGTAGTIKVLTVDGSGVVLTYQLVTPGSLYTVGTHASTGGTGTGFILSVDSVNPGHFTATLQTKS